MEEAKDFIQEHFIVKDILFVLLVYILLRVDPYNTLFSTIILILVPTVIYQVIIDKFNVKVLWLIPLVTAIFFYLFKWLGGFGLVGFGILVLLLVIYKVRQNYELFNDAVLFVRRRGKWKKK